MTSTFVYYTGIDKPPAARTLLRAGKLTLFFGQGDLRHIRYGKREVLRRVYVAVRDRNWGTVPAQISDLAIETDADAFRITFEALCTQDDIAFRWRGTITGEADRTLTFFTELNREPPDTAGLDLVFYAANPQVHACDTLSLVENLAGLGETLQSAHRLADGKPVVISPVTLKARFNVVATGPETEPAPGKLPKPVDPRQLSLFGAGWTLGSLKYLAQYGAASVTYYETTGWRGVMETATGSPNPDMFPSLPGSVFPMYHVLAAVGAFAAGTVLTPPSSDPLRVESLVLSKDGRTRVLVANLDARPVRVRLGGLPSRASLKLLDETTIVSAPRSSWKSWKPSTVRISACASTPSTRLVRWRSRVG